MGGWESNIFHFSSKVCSRLYQNFHSCSVSALCVFKYALKSTVIVEQRSQNFHCLKIFIKNPTRREKIIIEEKSNE